MKRVWDAAAFNRIANDADVRPWLGGTGAMVLSAVVENPDNYCLMTDKQDGGYILTKLAAGLYSVHTLALPSARGRPMLRLMREGFRAMFTATDCLEVWTFLPDGADNAEAWARLAGFRPSHRREGFFRLGSDIVGGEYRCLSFADWALRDDRNRQLGELFHSDLEAAGVHTDHAEDPVHDHWVGAALACAAEGQLHKGIGQYNRWALVTGYLPARIESLTPPIVNIGSAVVELNDGRVQISAAA